MALKNGTLINGTRIGHMAPRLPRDAKNDTTNRAVKYSAKRLHRRGWRDDLQNILAEY